MSTRTLIAGVAALLTLGALSLAYQVQGTRGGSAVDKTKVGGAENAIRCEPLVVFDESGLTQLGMSHRHLAIYSNGLASLTEAIPGKEVRAVTKMLEDGVGDLLLYQLTGQGAQEMQDQQTTSMDLPLSTVTVFQGATDAQAHTFSYWVASGTHQEIDDYVENFITQNFPAGR